jgi:hypothetical protein
MVSQPHAFSWSDHGASEMKKRSIHGQFVLVSHHEAFESADPSEEDKKKWEDFHSAKTFLDSQISEQALILVSQLPVIIKHIQEIALFDP